MDRRYFSYFLIFLLIIFNLFIQFLFFQNQKKKNENEMKIIGGNLTDFNKNYVLKESSFNSEKDFLRMMMLLLNDLKKIHTANILHRDIKCDNIMFYEKNKKLFFCFIDFGSSFDLSNQGGKERIKTYTPIYSAPEQNTPQESFESNF